MTNRPARWGGDLEKHVGPTPPGPVGQTSLHDSVGALAHQGHGAGRGVIGGQVGRRADSSRIAGRAHHLESLGGKMVEVGLLVPQPTLLQHWLQR
jgi:hypothetical protein